MARRNEKIREAGSDELHAQEKELTEQIFRLRFQLSTGQAEALRRLRDAKKDLARVKTYLRAQEISAGAPVKAAKAKQETKATAAPVEKKPAVKKAVKKSKTETGLKRKTGKA